MKISFKFAGQMVIMSDTGPVICGDEAIREAMDIQLSLEAVMLGGDVTRSPVAMTLDRIRGEITELEYLPDQTIN